MTEPMKTNKIRLYDKVIHPQLYNGKEVFTVVGIRMNELELRDDLESGETDAFNDALRLISQREV